MQKETAIYLLHRASFGAIKLEYGQDTLPGMTIATTRNIVAKPWQSFVPAPRSPLKVCIWRIAQSLHGV